MIFGRADDARSMGASSMESSNMAGSLLLLGRPFVLVLLKTAISEIDKCCFKCGLSLSIR